MENRIGTSYVLIHACVYAILFHLGEGNPVEPNTCCKYVDDTFTCKDCGLNSCPDGIPKDTILLDLSHNFIEELDCLHGLVKLASVDASNNQITKIHRSNFEDVPNLLDLDLRHNHLCLNNISFPEDAFESLGNLQKLQIINNKCSSGHWAYPEKAFASLVNLESLSLPGLPDTDLGEGFAAMVNLQRLMISGLDSNLTIIGCDMFKSLEKSALTHLSLRSSNIHNLCHFALKPLFNLTYLNLACNPNLPAIDAIDAVNQMSGPTIQSFVIDGCKGRQRSLFSDQTLGSRFMNLENLSFRSLSETVSINLLVFLKVPKLKRIEAGGNFILYQSTKNWLGLALAFVSVSLESYDMSHFAGFYTDFEARFCSPGNLNDEELIFFPEYPKSIKPLKPQGQFIFDTNAGWAEGSFFLANLPPTIHYITAEYFTFGLQQIFSQTANPANQLWYVKLSNSLYDGPLKTMGNLNQLQMLYLDNCSISTFDGDPLDYPSLTHLYLRGNYFEKIEYGVNKQSPFALLTNLQVLDLSQNKLTHIIPEAFANLKQMQILKLADNKLTSADFQLANLNQLQQLDLSRNQITKLPKSVTAEQNEINRVRSEALETDLTGNEFDCDCQSADFLGWLKETEVTIIQYERLRCKEGVAVTSVNVRSLKLKCFMDRTGLSYILPILAAILILTVVVVLVWKNRWRLLYWNHLLREWMDSKESSETHESELFDVLVCNAEEDDTWVLDTMLPKLENDWSYRAFQRTRDIDPGTNEPYQIYLAIKRSSVVVFILTPDFVSNPEIDNVLRMTIEMKQDAFLLFRKEELPNLSKRHLVSRLMRTYSYLEYGSDQATQQNSWNRLEDFLKQHCSE